MSAELAPLATPQFLDLNGNPLSGGLLYTYEAGSTTPKAVYKNLAADDPHSNPIILNSRGEPPTDLRVFSGSYKFVLNDSSDVTIWTRDNVQTIADIISSTGALAVNNNLSDLNNVATAKINLGIDPLSTATEFAVTNGQSASNLAGMSFDGDVFSSIKMEAEIIRGTTVFANVPLAMQYLNSTWRVILGANLSNELHGVTFSVSQTTTVGQLRAALNSGTGDGTIKIKTLSFAA